MADDQKAPSMTASKQTQGQQLQVIQVPPGLEYLAGLDNLLFQQEVDMLEIFTGINCNNRFSILDGRNNRIYYAAENSPCLARYCLRDLRPFEINIIDAAGTTIITVVRNCTFGLYCGRGRCCCNTAEITASITGELLGTCSVVFHPVRPRFEVCNAAGERICLLVAPYCMFICGNVVFDMMTPDGSTNIGSVTKFFGGCVKEFCTHANDFGVQFPIDLDPRVKATIMGSVFMINFGFFERECK